MELRFRRRGFWIRRAPFLIVFILLSSRPCCCRCSGESGAILHLPFRCNNPAAFGSSKDCWTLLVSNLGLVKLGGDFLNDTCAGSKAIVFCSDDALEVLVAASTEILPNVEPLVVTSRIAFLNKGVAGSNNLLSDKTVVVVFTPTLSSSKDDCFSFCFRLKGGKEGAQVFPSCRACSL